MDPRSTPPPASNTGGPMNQCPPPSFTAASGENIAPETISCSASGDIQEAQSIRQDPSPSAGVGADTTSREIPGNLNSKKRNRAKDGPEACLTPPPVNAVSAAIASSNERPGEPVFFPYVGTVFSSYDEAKGFYNLYSWEIGFGIRDSRAKKNKNDYITRKDIVCSCEGLCTNPTSASARSGCKAKIELHRTPDHSWIVTKVVTDHNHALSVTFGEKKQWGSHSFIDPMTKEFIKKLRRNNISLGRVCSIVGLMSPDQQNPMRKQSVKDLCARLAQEDIKDDMQKTIAILKGMKEQDIDFDVRFKTSASGVIETMLWCTGKNKRDYQKYGDVVTFDTTYRTNLYNLPFGIFVGVNSHYQSIIFGGVLMDHERTEDFEWTFRNFIEMMDEKQPHTILTDQCQGMAAAIKTTMKGTRHRWCRWHVLRNAKQKIGPSYSKKCTFKKKFNRLITDVVSPSEFEATWSSLVAEYKLEDNKFMTRAYRYRGMWAKPYFMDIFCAGMTSTQRSESANHMLKQFIQRSAPMHIFVTKFRELQFAIGQEEDRQNFKTKLQRRKKRLGLPIELHAEEIYTCEMYKRFNNELYNAGAHTILSKSPNYSRFVVVHNNHLDNPNRVEHTVLVEGFEKVSCTCGLYEHAGLPCKHSLKVLLHLDRKEIPPGNIHHRWTRAFSEEGLMADETPIEDRVSNQSTEMKRRMLVMKALELSQRTDLVSDNELNTALATMSNLVGAPRQETQGARYEEPVGKENAGDFSNTIPISCPARIKKTGRPKNCSLKSWNNNSKLEKEKRRKQDESSHEASAEPRVGLGSKTRKLSDLLQVTMPNS